MKFLTSILSLKRLFLFTFNYWLLSGVKKLLGVCELYLLSKLLEGNWADDKIGCSIEWYFSSTFMAGSGPYIMLVDICGVIPNIYWVLHPDIVLSDLHVLMVQ